MLKTALREFQTETVNWMIKQENDHDGGLLLNEPGTGKTICCLKLILSNDSMTTTTLVVCPSGLVTNWVNEIKKHTLLKDENIFVYTGQNRKNLKITQRHVIFITSYNILAREVSENNNNTTATSDDGELLDSIFTKTFTRTILDEAHYIRNWNRKTFKSVLAIKSRLRWVVTATPIFNKVDDVYAYFRFLELEAIDSRKEWYKLTHSAGRGILTYKRLNDVMKSHSIRMTKSKVLSKELQPKNQIDVMIELRPFEQEFYENLWCYSMQRMQQLTSRLKALTGLTDMNSQMIKKIVTNNILVYILRLKQSCNNPWMVISKMRRLQNVNSLEKATEMLKFYNSSLNMEEECPVCFDNVANAIASPCGHKCCESCWDKIMRYNLNRCPKCRSDIETIDRIDVVQVNQVESNSNSDFEKEIKESSKIRKLVEIISEKLKHSEKVIVVSQWVKMLDITREIVDAKFPDITSVSLQGDVSMNRRQTLIEQFQNDKDVKICYLSLMSSAEGINLTAANNVVLLDTWWNTSKMIQVSDRVHRIGQTRGVNVYNLVVGGENSIEERIGRLISKKERLKNLVMKRWDIDEKKYDDEWIKLPVKLIG
jgi:SWI/SNF-related matrix-associated actin-dependent regulator of chromatin subfamily A3